MRRVSFFASGSSQASQSDSTISCDVVAVDGAARWRSAESDVSVCSCVSGTSSSSPIEIRCCENILPSLTMCVCFIDVYSDQRIVRDGDVTLVEDLLSQDSVDCSAHGRN